MARSVWKGTIPLGGLVTLQLEVFKGTEKYTGDEPLKQVCSCVDPEPFRRVEECVHGLPRLTDTGAKAGKHGVKVQLAAVRPDGSYAPIPAQELAAIDAAINDDTMLPLALLDSTDALSVDDLWYLAPNRHVAGSDVAIAAFYAYLRDEGKSMVARWNTRGRQHIVLIHAHHTGALAMTRVRYAQETRDPENAWLVGGNAVDPAVVQSIGALLAAEGIPSVFDVATMDDESVARKTVAIQRALAGELPTTTTAVAAGPSEPAPDLMAALTASIEQASKGKKPPRASQKKKEQVSA